MAGFRVTSRGLTEGPATGKITAVQLPTSVARSLDDARYGAVADVVTITDGAMTAASPVLTSATANFTADRVGKSIHVTGAGTNGFFLVTTILSWQSATQVTLAASAVGTVSGATCTYGTDNATALNQLLSDAAAGVGLAVIPGNKNYLVSTAVPQSNVRLIGGPGATLTKLANNQPLLSPANTLAYNSVTNLTIEGVTFVGEGQLDNAVTPNFLPGIRAGIFLQDGTNIRIRNNTFKNFTDGAIELWGGADHWVEDNRIINCVGAGRANAISVQTQVTAPTDYPARLTITGNHVTGCHAAPICVTLHETVATTHTPVRVVISGNDLSTNNFAGIALECAAGSGTTIAAQRQLIITGNLCDQTGAAGTGLYAIQITDNSPGPHESADPNEFYDIIVTDNLCTSTDNGIWVQGSHLKVSGNIVEAVTSGIQTTNNGQNAPVYNSVHDNDIYLPANAGHGVFCTTAHTSIADNNIIYTTGSASATGHGIMVFSTAYCRVKDNVVEFAPGHGIYFSSASDFVCKDNTVMNPSDGGGSNSGLFFASATIATTGNVNRVAGNHCSDNRATHKMNHGADTSGSSAFVGTIELIDNSFHGNLGSAAIGGGFIKVRGNSIIGSYNGINTRVVLPYTTLNQVGVGAGTTTVTLTSTSGFATAGSGAFAGGVTISWTGISGNNLTGCTVSGAVTTGTILYPAIFQYIANWNNSELGGPVQVYIGGGTVSLLTKTRASQTTSLPVTSGAFLLDYVDQINISYTAGSPPTVIAEAFELV